MGRLLVGFFEYTRIQPKKWIEQKENFFFNFPSFFSIAALNFGKLMSNLEKNWGKMKDNLVKFELDFRNPKTGYLLHHYLLSVTDFTGKFFALSMSW